MIMDLDEEIFYPLFDCEYFKVIDSRLFFQDNQEELDKINQLAEGYFKLLGEGGEGVAFAIGKSKDGISPYVLKIIFGYVADSKHNDIKLTGDKLWGNESGAIHEPVTHSSGQLIINEHVNSKFSKRFMAEWKIMENLPNPGIDDSKMNNLISAIEIYTNNMALKEAKNSGDDAFILKMKEDHWDTMPVVLSSRYLKAQNKEIRKQLAARLAREILPYPAVDHVILSLNKILEPGWLEDFIDGMLYQAAVRGKTDFHSGNLGIRESTGRLVWFDT